ncbi:unnamed protein product, partial [Amoebophrya sp. A25]
TEAEGNEESRTNKGNELDESLLPSDDGDIVGRPVGCDIPPRPMVTSKIRKVGSCFGFTRAHLKNANISGGLYHVFRGMVELGLIVRYPEATGAWRLKEDIIKDHPTSDVEMLSSKSKKELE